MTMLSLLFLLTGALAITDSSEVQMDPLLGLSRYKSIASIYLNDFENEHRFEGAGVVISPSYILTTALTCGSFSPSKLKARFGSFDREPDGPSDATFKSVVEVTPHPLFNITTQDYDYCLIKLEQVADVIPALLPIVSVDNFRRPALVGWGTTSPKGPDVLAAREATVNLQQTCEDAWKGIRDVTPRMNCNLPSTGTTSSACANEFGSPTFDVLGRTVLGLASWGTWSGGRFRKGGIGDCTAAPRPNVNADVFAVDSWIRKTTGIPF